MWGHFSPLCLHSLFLGSQGGSRVGKGGRIPLLFTPAFHQIEPGDFAANPGGHLASGREDEDAAITFGNALGPGHNPSPKHHSAWAALACPQGLGTAAGDPTTGWRHLWGLCRAALLLSAGRSLHLVAESRTTDWGQGGLGPGAVSSPAGQRRSPSTHSPVIHH